MPFKGLYIFISNELAKKAIELFPNFLKSLDSINDPNCIVIDQNKIVQLQLCYQCNSYQALFPIQRTLSETRIVYYKKNSLNQATTPNFYSDFICRKINNSHNIKRKSKRNVGMMAVEIGFPNADVIDDTQLKKKFSFQLLNSNNCNINTLLSDFTQLQYSEINRRLFSELSRTLFNIVTDYRYPINANNFPNDDKNPNFFHDHYLNYFMMQKNLEINSFNKTTSSISNSNSNTILEPNFNEIEAWSYFQDSNYFLFLIYLDLHPIV